MTSSPEVKSVSDSDIDDAILPLSLGSDSEDSEPEDLTKDAEEFVASYCEAFDTDKHAGFVNLASSDISFDWFGKEVHGPQHLQIFMAANIPDTKHMSVLVEPCVPETTIQTVVTGRKRRLDFMSPLASTNTVSVQGKLRFSRPGVLRKSKKDWHWERNFKLQLKYSVELSPERHSPDAKWKVQQVKYETIGKCKRALFK